MSILYKRYFGRLRLLKSSDVEENPGPRASRQSCRIVRELHKKLFKAPLLQLLCLSLNSNVKPILWMAYIA